MSAAPLLVTLDLDQGCQQHFEALRRRHFPPERNHLPAHVTLFHRLPAEAVEQVLADVADAAARPRFPVAVTGVARLGTATAYLLAAPELTALRDRLAAGWTGWLTRQDSRPYRPHVTVQNKVPEATAARLHADLERAFTPRACTAAGLLVWRYLGGPWEPVQRFAFSDGG